MSNMVVVDYRGINIRINRDEYDAFKKKRGYKLPKIFIDQYLINEANKDSINPENIIIDNVINQYTSQQIEDIVNDYLRIENEAWK